MSGRVIYTNENISGNQRVWVRERFNPVKCKDCGKGILFMKNLHGNYVPVDAVKKIVNEGDTNGSIPVIDEMGIVTTTGRRVGWPVHVCKTKNND